MSSSTSQCIWHSISWRANLWLTMYIEKYIQTYKCTYIYRHRSFTSSSSLKILNYYFNRILLNFSSDHLLHHISLLYSYKWKKALLPLFYSYFLSLAFLSLWVPWHVFTKTVMMPLCPCSFIVIFVKFKNLR